MGANTVKIPAIAVDPKGHDIGKPTVALLRGLSLLGKEGKEAGLSAAFTGPDSSVAVIEAGATAMSKWWATSGSVVGGGIWIWAGAHWPKDNPANERSLILSLAIVTAALLLGISHLLAADVRSRAAAAVATIDARRAVAERMIAAAAGSATDQRSIIVPLANPWRVHNTQVARPDAADWLALAFRPGTNGDGDSAFLLQKDVRLGWVPENKITVP